MAEYTIKDIARMAEVSTGTVSRVLNNAGNVDPVLYERTMKVLKSTNYLGEKRRRSNRTDYQGDAQNKICVVSPEMDSSWSKNTLWAEYLAGVQKACSSRNYKIEVQFAAPALTPRQMAEAVSGGSGILLKVTTKVPEFVSYLPPELPVVCFGAYNPQLRYPQITMDNRGAGMYLAEHLLGLGHRRIAFVSRVGHRMFVARLEGYMEAMRNAGCVDEKLVIELEEVDGSVKYPTKYPPKMDQALQRLMEISPRPTAVIFANDWEAAGFYQACAAAGISIADHFSICGIDNDPICEVLTPRLSSMELPIAETAEFATSSLLDLIEGVGIHRLNRAYVQYLPGNYHERDSVKRLK